MAELSIDTERPAEGIVARPLRICEMEGSPVTPFAYVRGRLTTFLLDWFIVFYIFYCVDYTVTELIRITNIWTQNEFDVSYVAQLAPYTAWLEGLRIAAIWPVWLFLALEIAILWGCLGVTIGSKIGGQRVVREAEDVRYTWPSLGQRLKRWLGWNLPILFLLVVAFVVGAVITLLGIDYAVSVANIVFNVRDLLISLGWALALLPLLVVALWPLRDEKGQTVVDRLAGTLVVPKELAVGETERGRPWYRTSWGLVAILFLLLTYLTGYLITEIDIPKIFIKWPFASKIIGRFFDPNWDIIGQMLEKMVETIYLALMATTLAIPVAGGLSFLGARNMMPRTWWGTGIYYVMRTFFNIFRSVEPIAWGIIFAAWVGIGPFAGMLALAVHSIAALGKLYSEQVESIDMGPVEAITSTGANKLQTIIYAVVPQVIPPFTAFTLYRWDINVRMSTIIGMVGGGGIGQWLIQYQQLLKWSSVGLIVWLITIVVWVMDISSGKIRERMV